MPPYMPHSSVNKHMLSANKRKRAVTISFMLKSWQIFQPIAVILTNTHSILYPVVEISPLPNT